LQQLRRLGEEQIYRLLLGESHAMVVGLLTMNKMLLYSIILVICLGVAGLTACFFVVNHSYKYATTRRQMLSVAESLRSYYRDRGNFPPDVKEFLRQQQLSLVDQWDGDIRFEMAEQAFTITSFGSDGKRGGKGWRADIVITWQEGDKDFRIEGANIHP
jgi:hypothetical protein